MPCLSQLQALSSAFVEDRRKINEACARMSGCRLALLDRKRVYDLQPFLDIQAQQREQVGGRRQGWDRCGMVTLCRDLVWACGYVTDVSSATNHVGCTELGPLAHHGVSLMHSS